MQWIINRWLHCLTSESKGRFPVNDIFMFGSAWRLVMLQIHPPLLRPITPCFALPPPPPPSSKWTSYVYLPICKINVFSRGKNIIQINFDFHMIIRKNICNSAFLILWDILFYHKWHYIFQDQVFSSIIISN